MEILREYYSWNPMEMWNPTQGRGSMDRVSMVIKGMGKHKIEENAQV